MEPVKPVKQVKPEEEALIRESVLTFVKLTTMTNSETFEDLIVWQEAITLAKEVFILFENCKNFSLKNQIERAAISISANIAEGYELETNKQCIKHLFIAKASCGEVRSFLILASELNVLPADMLKRHINSAGKLSIMIFNLIKARGWKKK